MTDTPILDRLNARLKTPKYPEPLDMDVGCKVIRRTYATEDDANKCAEVAAEEREVQLSRGYDFGYCWPGDITKNEDGTYTVVCP